jgi:Bacterial Ig domain
VSNEGGWCGVTLTRGGVAYESYLMVTRPNHGKVFAHRVGANTRIDYTPDTGFTGTDSFAVRLIPGNAVIREAVTVTR